MSVSAFPRVCDRLRKHSFRFGLFAIGYCCVLVLTSERVPGQATTFAGNAQHTSSYAAPAQNLNVFKWIASIDLNNTGDLIHYGAPLITSANTVLVTLAYRHAAHRVFNASEIVYKPGSSATSTTALVIKRNR